MLPLTASLVETHKETVALNWQYRRQYLLDQVIKYDQMQLIEHAAPYWLIHYLSEQYGGSVARLTEEEWQELRQDYPEFAYAVDQIQQADTSCEPHEPEGPSIQQQLAGTHLYIPGDQQFPEPGKQTRPVPEPAPLLDPAAEESGQAHLPDTQSQDRLTRSGPPPEFVVLSTEAPDVQVLATLQRRGKVVHEAIAEAAPEPHTGKRTPKQEAKRQERIARKKAEAKERRELAKHPPLPKLPEPVELPPLVLPTLRTLGMAGFMHNTFELKVITNSADNSHYWLLAENSNATQGVFTVLDALLQRQSLYVRYYKAPRRYTWATLNTQDPAVQEIPFSDIFATAVGFFAGRVLGALLAYQDGQDEPSGDTIQQFLLDADPAVRHLDKPYHLERILEGLPLALRALHRDVRDRLELPVRLLQQVQRTSSLNLVGRRDERLVELGTGSGSRWLTLKELVERCNLCWTLNATLPAGYAFFQGLLNPRRLLFTQQESGLLRELLSLTNKATRP